ncbi:MAG TPA: TetR family transcriptional regulator [Streptosporangiaceae bacterium]|nr:TetR family transcriptional regulator [Streptosporangiaceae bacterium]
MAVIGQEGALARTHEGEPGLPRGRSGLPTEAVRAAQRERLLRAVIAAVAESGFRDVTVADIVRRARVSRAAFYAHFADKEDCFLAATRHGGELLGAQMLGATRALPPDTSAEDVLRASIAAFLGFLVAEPAFARAFYIDMPAAGPGAVRQVEEAQRAFARLDRAWHQRARRDNPAWPEVPALAYYALAGASAELVRAEVRQGEIHAAALRDTLFDLHLAVLAARPWPLPDSGAADGPVSHMPHDSTPSQAATAS